MRHITNINNDEFNPIDDLLTDGMYGMIFYENNIQYLKLFNKRKQPITMGSFINDKPIGFHQDFINGKSFQKIFFIL